MCEQCLTHCITFGEVLPGFHLMRARRDGNEWKKGQWGLIEINDPTVVWYTTPVHHADITDYFDIPEEFLNAFKCYPVTGFRMVSAAKQVGYEPRRDGFFEYWLYERLAKHIAENDFRVDDDPLPNIIETDISIGKEPLPNEKEILDKYQREGLEKLNKYLN